MALPPGFDKVLRVYLFGTLATAVKTFAWCVCLFGS
jgi:hypothetical protein